MQSENSKFKIQSSKFSFIIPAYNEEKYIGLCLTSIFELDGFGDSEVIVVDNASSDKTAEVVRTNFPKAKLIQETRKGTGWAREAGFRASGGNLLVFIDADSVLPKNWVKGVMDVMAIHPNGIAYSGAYDLGLKGISGFLIELYYIFIMQVFSLILNFFKIGGVLLAGNMIIRREALEKIGGFDTHITFWGDDTLLAKRLRKVGPVYFFKSLCVYSSPRRVMKEGMVRLALLYPLNAIWVLLFNKPFSKTNTTVR